MKRLLLTLGVALWMASCDGGGGTLCFAQAAVVDAAQRSDIQLRQDYADLTVDYWAAPDVAARLTIYDAREKVGWEMTRRNLSLLQADDEAWAYLWVRLEHDLTRPPSRWSRLKRRTAHWWRTGQ